MIGISVMEELIVYISQNQLNYQIQATADNLELLELSEGEFK